MKSSVPMGTNRMHETGMRKDRRDSHVRTLPGSVLGRRPLRLLLSLGLALLLVGPGLLSSPTPNDPGPRTDTQGGLDPGTLSGGVLQDEHRASARLGAFVDVLASPDPIPIMPEGVTDINFTFTEMNKVGAVIRSFEWRLSTLDGTTIKDAYATRICSVDLDGDHFVDHHHRCRPRRIQGDDAPEQGPPEGPLHLLRLRPHG